MDNNEKTYSIDLTEREIETLSDALSKWKDVVDCKDVGAEVGLNAQRYFELVVKLGFPLCYRPSTALPHEENRDSK